MQMKTSSLMRRSACACALAGLSLSTAFAQQDWVSTASSGVTVACTVKELRTYMGWYYWVPTPEVWNTFKLEYEALSEGKSAKLIYSCQHTNNFQNQRTWDYKCEALPATADPSAKFELTGTNATVDLPNGTSGAAKKVCDLMFRTGGVGVRWR